MIRLRPAATSAAALTVSCLLLAGCGESHSEATAQDQNGITVTNCDRTLSLPKEAERIVTLYPSMTELLIQLGAADKIVGQANTNLSPPAPELAEEFAAVPVLSTGIPAKEALLEARPDLIVSDGEYWFDGKRLQTMEELTSLGIPIFVNSGYCHKEVTKGEIGAVWTDLDALGTLIGTSDAAKSLAEAGKSSLSETRERISGKAPVPTVMVQPYEGQSSVLARGLYSSVLTAAGGVNLFEDDLPPEKYFASMSTETILEKAPRAILVIYSTEDAKESTLAEARTTFAATPAVASGAIFAVPEAWFAGELASIDGVAEVAELLHPGV